MTYHGWSAAMRKLNLPWWVIGCALPDCKFMATVKCPTCKNEYCPEHAHPCPTCTELGSRSLSEAAGRASGGR